MDKTPFEDIFFSCVAGVDDVPTWQIAFWNIQCSMNNSFSLIEEVFHSAETDDEYRSNQSFIIHRTGVLENIPALQAWMSVHNWQTALRPTMNTGPFFSFPSWWFFSQQFRETKQLLLLILTLSWYAIVPNQLSLSLCSRIGSYLDWSIITTSIFAHAGSVFDDARFTIQLLAEY